MEARAATLEDLEQEAARFVRGLSLKEEATLVALSGELGAGKTAFTKAAAKTLGVEEPVTSPTFVLEKVYALPENPAGFTRLVHIDAYRLKGGKELAPLMLEDLMRDPGTLVFLEWPEQVADGLPPPAHRITITAGEDGARTLSYEG